MLDESRNEVSSQVKARVAVLGAGSWGVALGRSLSKSGHEVCLWEIDPAAARTLEVTRQVADKLPGVHLDDSVGITPDMGQAVEGAQFVLVVVPTRFFENTVKTLHQVRPDLSGLDGLLIASKGLIHPGGKRLSVAAGEILGASPPLVTLSGPSHAEEVGRDLPTALVAASDSETAAENAQKILMTSRLRVYTNPDVVGVELGGAIKNVLAIASGISDGMGFGDNSRAALITRGLLEMSRLGEALGGRPETFRGLTGLGDLVVTCTSRHSRNRKLGELIGTGLSAAEAIEKIGMVAEGYYTAENVVDLEEKYDLDLPICREVYRILYEGKNPAEAVGALMQRERKSEDGF
jgi:glycerol-3-phosphate dehydrogenase (NAD(P)+)